MFRRIDLWIGRHMSVWRWIIFWMVIITVGAILALQGLRLSGGILLVLGGVQLMGNARRLK